MSCVDEDIRRVVVYNSKIGYGVNISFIVWRVVRVEYYVVLKKNVGVGCGRKDSW